MMTPILTYPDYEGARYSRTSVDLSVDMIHRINGWTGWGVERNLTPGKGWGGRANAQVRTRGKSDPKMNLKMYAEDYNLLVNYLAAKGAALGKGFMEVSFTLVGTLYEVTLNTTVWVGLGARIMKEGMDIGTANDDNVEISVDLDVMNVSKDGIFAVLENTPLGQVGVSI